MTVTFAEKLARIPHYEPGTSLDDAKARRRDRRRGQARLERVPAARRIPAVVEVIARGRQGVNRYPDPKARALRRRHRRSLRDRAGADRRLATAPARSCSRPPLALCEPGDEILYAWPSFSIYPYLAPLSGAREIRVPLAEGDVHDLDAMLEEVTAATQLV